MALIDDIASDASLGFSDFGVAAVFDVFYTPTTVKVIFNRAGQVVEAFDGQFQATGPQLIVPQSVITPVKGQAVSVSGVDYTVGGHPEDTGTGLWLVTLRED